MASLHLHLPHSLDHLPVLDWLQSYQRPWLRGDGIAALTLWALVVPQAIAYAQIAGLPPEAGLFASFGGLLGYALLGTSRQLIVSPTSSTAAISAALVAPVAAGNSANFVALSSALALLCGIILIGLGLANLGFVSRFIASAVQTGFMVGLGLTIIVGQLPKLFGVPASDGDFFAQAAGVLRHLDDTNWQTAVLGFGSLGFMAVCKRRYPTLPASLIAVAVTIVLTTILRLEDHGVAVIGGLDSSLPSFVLPQVSWGDLKTLIPGTLAIAIIGFAESSTVSESLAEEHRYEVNPDRELIALGSANIISGVFQGFITGGGASQSAANDRAGANSQLSGLVTAGLMLLTAAALLPLFKNLPQAVLGAIVINAVAGFVNLDRLRRLAGLRRDSFILAVFTLAAVLLLGILNGLLIAVALSIIVLLERFSRPTSSALGRVANSTSFEGLENTPDAQPLPGVFVYRLNAPLLFVNAKRIRDDIRKQLSSGTDVVVIDLVFSNTLDIESLDVLLALRRDMTERGVELWLADLHREVKALLVRASLAGEATELHLFRNMDDVSRALARRDAAMQEQR